VLRSPLLLLLLLRRLVLPPFLPPCLGLGLLPDYVVGGFAEVGHVKEEATAGKEGGVRAALALLAEFLGGGREGRGEGGREGGIRWKGGREKGMEGGREGGREEGRTLTRRRASSALVLSREA